MADFVVDQKLLARGIETPRVNLSPLPEYAYENLDYGMTIGVARTRGGRLFACWVGGGDNPKAFFLVAFSDDDGVTWSQPIVVIDPHDDSLPCDRCTIVGTLWVDPIGRLWMIFNQTLLHFDGRSSNWYIRCDQPDAASLDWTAPDYIWHGETLNKPITLSSGEWMMPISLWARHHISEPFKGCFHELDGERKAHVFVSNDDGATWSSRGGVVFPETRFDEHMVLERRDGTLWMLGRTTNGLMESVSTDRGRTWATPQRAVVQSVSARFHLRRLSSGRVLLIKHGPVVGAASEKRTHLTAFLSDDDGKSWSKGFVIDERFEISYPDADESPDGRIFVTYDRNRATDGEILMAAIRERDILEGQIVCSDSFLKRVIVSPGKAPNKVGARK